MYVTREWVVYPLFFLPIFVVLSKRKNILRQIFKVAGWISLVLFLLLAVLLLFIRSPFGQKLLVGKATSYVSEKTNTKFSIDRLFVTFRGDLFLEGLYLEDQRGDTLIYSHRLETGVSLLPFFRKNELAISRLEWEGLQANVRRDTSGTFNFDFLLEAFSGSPADSTSRSEPQQEQPQAFPEISTGPVVLQQWKIRYEDDFSGTDATLDLGELNAKLERMSLDSMAFHVSNLHFENSEFSYIQREPLPEETDSSDSELALPLLILDRLSLSNIHVQYQSLPDGMDLEASIGEFLLDLPEANLPEKRIRINRVQLKHSQVAYRSLQEEGDTRTGSTADAPADDFSWPEWNIELASLDLVENEIRYQVADKPVRTGEFDPDNLVLTGINMEFDHVFFTTRGAGASVKQLAFRERSGFALEKFQLDLGMDTTGLRLEEIRMATGSSKLAGALSLSFESLDRFIARPEDSGFAIRLGELGLGLTDAYYFAPELREDPYLRILESKPLSGEIEASGTLQSVKLENVAAHWGSQTGMHLHGQIGSPIDPERISWRLDTLTFASVREDLNRLYPQDSLGIAYPDNLGLALRSEGTLEEFSLNSRLDAFESSMGLEATATAAEGGYTYALRSDLSSFPLGNLLQNSELGNLGFTLIAEGNTGPPEALDLVLETQISEWEVFGHDYAGLRLQADISEGLGKLELSQEEEFLDLQLRAEVDLDPNDFDLQLDFNLNGADLNGLNLSSRMLRIGMDLTANAKGNGSSYELQSQLRNGTVVLEEQSLPMGDWDLALGVSPDTTDFRVESNLLQGTLHANADPSRIMDGLLRHVNRYFSDSLPRLDRQDSTGLLADLVLKVRPTLLLDEVVLPGLERMDEGSIEVTFDEANAALEGRVDFPYLSNSGLVMDSLGIRIHSDSENFDFGFGLVGLESGPVSLGRTYVTGKILEKMLYLDFNAWDEEELLTHVAFDVSPVPDSLRIHVNPDSLIFNRKEWTVPPDNEVLLGPSLIGFREFAYSREGQEFSIANKGDDAIALKFNDFRLATFTTLLNTDEMVASGLLNGEVVVENPFGATGLLADITIRDLGFLEVPLGNLSLNAATSSQNSYDFDLALADKGIELQLSGGYRADPEGAQLDLALNLERLDMDVLAGLSAGNIRDGSGYLSGSFGVEGSINSPRYQGSLRFQDTEFSVSALNAAFTLDNQEIDLDQTGVFLNQLTIRDAQGNEFKLDGEISTESLSNPGFDLALETKNFRVLNSTVEDNDLFYGDAIIGANVTVQGDLNLPVVDAELTIEDGTNLSFVVPESQLDVVEREGVVLFVNREDPEDVLTKRMDENVSAGFSGYQISALLNVSSSAIFNLVIDQRSGDNLLVEGAADLRLNIDPNGRINLTGRYELSRGHYELSLYNLVNRKFDIQEGSSITWAGDPLDATLDITAIYRIRTSAAGLMTAAAAGGSRENMAQYRQELPFLVYLMINGELLSPLISFRMDMPEDQRGAAGGSVYAQVQQLNNREGELNRQVFSLMVLNRFFPDGDNAGGGSTAAMARSSVSQLLSGQLKSLTDNVLGNSGLELDVDLDSFQDYQQGSLQARTQLNLNARKRFLDDRLVVQVGSQIDIEGSSQNRGAENTLLGNVSIEYLLTENGRYRLRGFRKNQFESFIDGQLVVTGVSAIFNREFNHFRELWKGIETRRNGSNLMASPTENPEKNPEN